MARQADNSEMPEGFSYCDDFLSGPEELDLTAIFSTLAFSTFEYHGFSARRRVIAYGWTYDFNSNILSPAAAIPEFLLPVRKRSAEYANVAPEELEEALLTEYSPGAPINWHRDLPMFQKIVGISLLSSCTMRLRPINKDRKPVSIVLQPRSLYLMQGDARWNFQHSIPPVKELRYSITFRSLRKRGVSERTHAIA